MITVVSVTDPKRSMSMLSQRDCQKFMLPWIHGRLLLKMVYIIYKMCMTLIAYFCVLLGVFWVSLLDINILLQYLYLN